jgi:hypothetical protein
MRRELAVRVVGERHRAAVEAADRDVALVRDLITEGVVVDDDRFDLALRCDVVFFRFALAGQFSGERVEGSSGIHWQVILVPAFPGGIAGRVAA